MYEHRIRNYCTDMNQGKPIHDAVNNFIAADLIFSERLEREDLLIKEGRYILGSVEQFNRLSHLMNQYREKYGCELELPELPNLAALIYHLKNDRMAQAVMAAIIVRGRMAVIIKQAEAAVAG